MSAHGCLDLPVEAAADRGMGRKTRVGAVGALPGSDSIATSAVTVPAIGYSADFSPAPQLVPSAIPIIPCV